MQQSAQPILVASRARLWERRAIGIFGIFCVVLGMFILVGNILSPVPEIPRGNAIAFTFVFGVGLVFLLVATLRFNLIGVWSVGIAPPMKPLAGLLREPFIFRWRELTGIELHPKRSAEKPPGRYSVTLTTTHGHRIRFGSDVVGNRFGTETRVRQLYSLLALSEGESQRPDFKISGQDSLVRRTLGATWPETGAYRRTKASWVGTLIGGPVGLIAAWFVRFGPNEYWKTWRGVFIISFFVFLWSLLSPDLFRKRPRRNGVWKILRRN